MTGLERGLQTPLELRGGGDVVLAGDDDHLDTGFGSFHNDPAH